MPGFYIKSLFERHLEKLSQRQDRVCQQIEGKLLLIEVFTCKETANVFQVVHGHPGRLPLPGRTAA